MGGIAVGGGGADALGYVVGGDGNGDEQHGAAFTACGHGDALRQVVQHDGCDHEHGGTAGITAAADRRLGQQAVQCQHPEHTYSKPCGTAGRGTGGKAFGK